MAFSTIKDKIEREVIALIKQNRDTINYVSGLGDNVILDLTLDPDDLAPGLIKGTDKIFDSYKGMDIYEFGHSSGDITVNTETNWKETVRELIKQIKTTSSLDTYSGSLQYFNAATTPIKPGVYILRRAKKSGTLDIRFVRKRNPNIKRQRVGDSAVTKFARAVRTALWKQWFKVRFDDLFTRSLESPGIIPTSLQTKNLTSSVTEVGHEKQTTKALLAFDKLKNAEPEMNFEGLFTLTDLYEQVLENLEITLERNTNKKVKGVFFGYIIDASLKENYAGSEPTDTEPLIKAINKAIKDIIVKKRGYLGLLLAYLSGSKPPVEQAVEDAAVDIVNRISKAKTVKKVSLKAKSFKPTRNRGVARKGKALKSSITKEAMLIRGSTTLGGRVSQTGKKTEKLSPARLKYLINRSLPAEVRRNMGRPALINQTGRFSNSVELTSLRQGQKTMIGEYTYQLDPYSTFENLGTKQWPTGYNPKPLISKSIRNIAERHVREKFTLRRI